MVVGNVLGDFGLIVVESVGDDGGVVVDDFYVCVEGSYKCGVVFGVDDVVVIEEGDVVVVGCFDFCLCGVCFVVFGL